MKRATHPVKRTGTSPYVRHSKREYEYPFPTGKKAKKAGVSPTDRRGDDQRRQ